MPEVTTISWTYDNLGRLIQEAYDSHDDTLDFTATYSFDLVGNRLEKTLDQGSNSTIDETITYTYDDNDRLLTEVKDLASGTDTTTTYEYGGPTNPGTEQTKKTVTETTTSALVQTVEYKYSLQGRLSEVVIETYSSGNVVKRETTTYEYNESDIRVASTHKVEVDDDQDPGTPLVVESETETDYLNDPQNPTGYSQVIEEITRDTATQNISKDLVFTLGHDVIAQTEIDPAQAGTNAGSPLFILYDGHGSTRFLSDINAAIQEGYSYDAYGNAIGFDPASALTALLFSGEPFDARINQQYLRARWYDLSTGRFNRLDPFAGNLRDPQSLHKYLYTHADSVNGIDPTGLFAAVGMLSSMNIGGGLRSMSISTIMRAGVSGFRKFLVSFVKQLLYVVAASELSMRIHIAANQQITPIPQAKLTKDYQYAKLTQAAYKRYASDAEAVAGPEWIWEDRRTVERTGFNAHVFIHRVTGERVMAFAGTNDLQDGITDLAQGFGLQDDQYDQAIRYAQDVSEQIGPIDRFVGHSLGGGLAAMSAMLLGTPGTTFNAAGVHPYTVARRGGSLANHATLIDAYRVQGEILSTAQDMFFGLPVLFGPGGALMVAIAAVTPNSNGTNYWLPARHPDLVRRHALDEVLYGMQAMME